MGFEKIIYVYVHVRADNGEPFYVGKGVGDRPYKKSGRTQDWKNIVSWCGYNVFILGIFCSNEDALIYEKYVSELYNSIGFLLCNKIDCGFNSGFLNGKHTEDSKSKISKRSNELWAEESYRHKIKLALPGSKNHYANKTVIDFYHPVYGYESMPQSDLRNKYNLGLKINKVGNGKAFSHKGWILACNKELISK